MNFPCHFCNKDVSPSIRGTLRLVEGWEKIRGKSDGVFPLKNRKIKGTYCHEVCLDIAMKGGKQEAML